MVQGHAAPTEVREKEFARPLAEPAGNGQDGAASALLLPSRCVCWQRDASLPAVARRRPDGRQRLVAAGEGSRPGAVWPGSFL